MAEKIKLYDTLEDVINKAKYGLYTREDYNSHHYTQEVEKRFGISASAFYQLLHKGVMPSLKKVPAKILDEVTMTCLKIAFDKGGATVVEIMTDEQKRTLLNDDRIKSIIHYRKSSKNSFFTTWIGHKLIQHVPIHLISNENIEYFRETVKNNIKLRDGYDKYFSIQGIHEDLLDEDTYMEACLANGDNLKYVPEDYKDKDFCEAIVVKHGDAIKYVPENIRHDLYTIAIKSGEGLSSIPVEDRTEKICSIAVETNSEMFKEVPDDIKTYGMCLKAVDDDAGLMAYVPNKHIDEEMVVRFFASIFMKNFRHDFIINEDWRETGEKSLLKSVFEKFGITKSSQKRELAKKLLSTLKVIAS